MRQPKQVCPRVVVFKFVISLLIKFHGDQFASPGAGDFAAEVLTHVALFAIEEFILPHLLPLLVSLGRKLWRRCMELVQKWRSARKAR